jgi:hypothetical protein
MNGQVSVDGYDVEERELEIVAERVEENGK